MRAVYCSIILILLIFLLVSCSKDNYISLSEIQIDNVSTLPVGVTERFSDGSPAGGVGVLGIFNLKINPFDVTASLNSIRISNLTDVLEVVDITNFMQLAPCTNCAKIRSVSKNAYGDIILTIGIKHPFGVGDPLKPITGRNRADLHVFNVEGTIISQKTGVTFTRLDKKIAGFMLKNADGYSSYLDIVIDEFYQTEASIHPYVMHFDDYSSGNFNASNPMGFESVTDPPPSGNLVMAMGSDYDYKDYIFDIDGEMDFIYAIGCTYGVSCASMNDRFNPQYRIPQHNKKAASEVNVAVVANELRSGDTTSYAQIEVRVVDINHGVGVGDALNEMLADSSVKGISLEVPGVTNGKVDIPTTSPVGSGHSTSDPLIYQGVIYNTLGASDGMYLGLVKVIDSYPPGLNVSPLLYHRDGIKRVKPGEIPLVGSFDINEFATYQVFRIGVGVSSTIQLITPNGGEEWEGMSYQNITWQTSGYAGDIKLEYSKDNFVSDIHLIASATPDDGLYEWHVPNDPSDTVKVRASLVGVPSISDISDNYFRILEKTYDVFLDADYTINSARIDFAPSNIVLNDGRVVISYIREYANLNFTSDFVISSDSGATWEDPPYSSWGGTPTVPTMTTMALDANGDYYHKAERGEVSVLVKFTIPWPNTGVNLTSSSNGIELIFTYDGYPLEFGDYNGTIKMKKGLEQNSPLSGGWTGWSTTPQITVVPSPAYLSKTPAIVKDSSNGIHLAYFSSNPSNVWIRKAVNENGTGAPWINGINIYDGSADGYDRAKEPSMRIGYNGVWHCAFVLHTHNPTSTESIAYVRSPDGNSWSQPIMAFSKAGQNILNNPSVASVDVRGQEIVVITYWDSDMIYLTFSWDGGNTWQTPVALSGGNDKLPNMCAGLDGYVHTVWENHDPGDIVIRYKRAHFE